ncbi:hypothetical protein CEXT_101231 [Caerostris extrusa]|uniref:Uncharacterized protein n=1 Tax=Caerostris extrusa TaxID=172846 RepID=A0AAV4U224_CAEEX|nr:hypothetical protein CEXT_101231 [Caerostris extrusa]
MRYYGQQNRYLIHVIMSNSILQMNTHSVLRINPESIVRSTLKLVVEIKPKVPYIKRRKMTTPKQNPFAYEMIILRFRS